jgi:predicted mannosyl-3-phosphoglycerate phosphatase (HAD superfamily)
MHTARTSTHAIPGVSSRCLVVFSRIDGALGDPASGVCDEARSALALLMARGVPLVLVSNGEAEGVKRLQCLLGITEPFVCNDGALLYIPRGYFTELDGLSTGDDEWEIFTFKAPDPARAVRLLSSLFAVNGDDPITIGLGCGWDDRTLLAEVDVPVIVRNDSEDQARLRRHLPNAYVTQSSGGLGWSEAVIGT